MPGKTVNDGKIAVCLDFGNVVATWKHRPEVFAQVVAGLGGNVTSCREWVPLFDFADNNHGYIQTFEPLDTGRKPYQEFLKELYRRTGLRVEKVPHEVFCALVWREGFDFKEEVIRFLIFLQRHYALVAVSNGDWGSRYVEGHLRVKGVRFAQVFISCEQGEKKPKLFARVRQWLESNGFTPELCPYIDDHEPYVRGARDEYGFKAVQFDCRHHKVSDLRDMLAGCGIRVFRETW